MSKINWAEIMEANRDSIIDKMVQAKKESHGCMSGWAVHVEINEEGEAWVGGLMSQDSQSMSSWNGETFIVARVQSWTVEVDEDECIKNEKEMYAEFLAQQESEDGHQYAHEFMQEKYPDKIYEWVQEAIEFEIDNYPEEADAYIDRRIEEEKLCYQYQG